MPSDQGLLLHACNEAVIDIANMELHNSTIFSNTSFRNYVIGQKRARLCLPPLGQDISLKSAVRNAWPAHVAAPLPSAFSRLSAKVSCGVAFLKLAGAKRRRWLVLGEFAKYGFCGLKRKRRDFKRSILEQFQNEIALCL